MHAYRECAVSFAVLDDQCVMRGSFLTDYVHFFRSVILSVFFFPGFSRDFDCFDFENEWDGKVVFVGF